MAKFRFHKIAAVAVLDRRWRLGRDRRILIGRQRPERGPGRGSGRGRSRPKAPLRTVAVVTPPRVKHARAIRISGQTEAEKRVTLATRVMGVIESLPVKQGERVKRGDLVMRLDAEDKEAAVRMAESVVTQRQAEADAAERLVKGGNAPKLQADQARAALATAKSQLEGAKAELAQYEIYAPFNGLIDRVPVQRGSAILAGAEVATLINLDPLLAIGEVSERDLQLPQDRRRGRYPAGRRQDREGHAALHQPRRLVRHPHLPHRGGDPQRGQGAAGRHDRRDHAARRRRPTRSSCRARW